MEFEFSTAERVIFGEGKVSNIGSLASQFGDRALLVCGSHPEKVVKVVDLLKRANVQTVVFPVSHEPSLELVREGSEQVKMSKCKLVIAYGGGSVIDAGKAIAIFATNKGDVLDYLEVIGKGHAITRPALPMIAIPTTAGTGAEVTKNAVLGAPEFKLKVSVRSNFLTPRIALIDPELTYSMPPSVTASTGMDALTQLIEPFVSLKSNPLTDSLCREGINRVAGSLMRAYDDDGDVIARRDMCLASLFSGMALANAKLGAVHGIASVIGGMVAAPHGEICARLLPYVMQANINALESLDDPLEVITRYREVAQRLIGKPQVNPLDGVEWALNHNLYFGIRFLSQFGITRTDIALIAKKSMQASSTQGNPVKLTEAQISSILEGAMG